MSFTESVQHLIAFLAGFKYIVLFVGVIIEGPVIMITSGFLIHTGFFSLPPAVIAIIAGDLVGDIVWYAIGYYLAGPVLTRRRKFLSVTPELFDKAKELFRKYHVKILLISKVTIGFGMALATLIAAGATKISFKKYMILNTIGECILVAIMLIIGYFFGEVYVSISGGFKIVFIVFWIIAVVVAVYKFTKYMKRKIAHL